MNVLVIHHVGPLLPRHPKKMFNPRLRSDIDRIIVHHTAVPATVGAQRIATYHVDILDWPGIGYHFIVGADGDVEQCNDLDVTTWHAGKKFNRRSVGVCMLGCFQKGHRFYKGHPPDVQLEATRNLLQYLVVELDLPVAAITPHRHVVATKCPGSTWRQWWDELRWNLNQER